MNKIRIIASSFFSFALAFSIIGYNAPLAGAENSSLAPKLISATAINTGGTSSKEEGDTIVLEFSEPTNKFRITNSNIGTEFGINHGHSFLDGSGALGVAEWNEDGTELTIALSDGTSLPSIMPGDGIALNGTDIKDIDGNSFNGSTLITGNFSGTIEENCPIHLPKPSVTPMPTQTPMPLITPTPTISATIHGELENKNESIQNHEITGKCRHHEHNGKYRCGTGLLNGKLFKIKGSPTVFLLVGCRFKPFRGSAAFHSRGLKFTDISEMTNFPPGMNVSDEPVVPAEGTLVKGSDKTVWFVDANGKKRGFTSAEVFIKLGFKFDKVDQISDSDLETVDTDEPVDSDTTHPDGAVIKCGNSDAVFTVIGKMKFPFANSEAFQAHGHRFDHVLNVDCGKFAYKEGAPISQ